MGDYYQSPEPGWKSDIAALSKEVADLRKEVKLGTKLVIWGFSISWVAVLAMYVAGFAFYLPSTIKPLEDRLDKIDGIDGKLDKIDGKMAGIRDQLSDLKVDVAKIGVKRAAPVTGKPLTKEQDSKSPIAPENTLRENCGMKDAAPNSFGEVRIGRWKKLVIEVSGERPFVLSQASIGGPDDAEFSLTKNNCTMPVAVGRSCAVEVTFYPRQAGRRIATLNFNCNSTNPITEDLIGVGINGDGP
jgi:hypothetical protein